MIQFTQLYLLFLKIWTHLSNDCDARGVPRASILVTQSAALVARVQAASRASWMSKFTGEDDSTHRPRLKSQDLWM